MNEMVERLNAQVNALAAQNSTTEEVAEFMADAGARGRRRAPASCPLARYFKGLLVDYPNARVSVTPEKVTVDGGAGSGLRTVRLPQTLRRFVEEFDQGKFPELEVTVWTGQRAGPPQLTGLTTAT